MVKKLQKVVKKSSQKVVKKIVQNLQKLVRKVVKIMKHVGEEEEGGEGDL
jgi:hypothetical protein